MSKSTVYTQFQLPWVIGFNLSTIPMSWYCFTHSFSCLVWLGSTCQQYRWIVIALRTVSVALGDWVQLVNNTDELWLLYTHLPNSLVFSRFNDRLFPILSQLTHIYTPILHQELVWHSLHYRGIVTIFHTELSRIRRTDSSVLELERTSVVTVTSCVHCQSHT